jgi:endoglucanase
MKHSVLASLFATGALAQGGAWQQCGGVGFSGSTSCVSGYTCVYLNDWYSQCQPQPTTLRTTTTPGATSTTRSAPAATSTTPAKGKFKWFGINQSCAEFGKGEYPGLWGKHFTFPSTSSIQVCY